MELNLPVALGILVAIIAAGTGGLIAAPMMSTNTILTMVTPSMAVFALITFAIGVKHGEYRATAR
jgi:hypothetical protein